MNSPHITYTRRSDATSEGEVAALANLYKFVLAKKEVTRPGSPDDAKEIKNDSRHRHRNT
jgi:hypothetical protein